MPWCPPAGASRAGCWRSCWPRSRPRPCSVPMSLCWSSSPPAAPPRRARHRPRSEEHTSELQSPCNLVCRLLLEKKKQHDRCPRPPHAVSLMPWRHIHPTTSPLCSTTQLRHQVSLCHHLNPCATIQ